MSKFHVTYLIAFFFATGFQVKTQNIELILKVGDELYQSKDYYGSVQFYNKALQIDSTNAEVLYKYARNLAIINNHKSASRYFQKSLLLGGTTQFPTLNYELGESLRSNGEYRKSRRYYNKALAPYRREKDSYWYQRINQSKESAAWANKNNTTKVASPRNLGKSVNGEFSEFGAVIHNKKFYFSAMIADSVTDNNRIKDQHYYSRIYSKSLTESGENSILTLDEKAIKAFQNMHLANPAFFEDDFYFSVCDSNFSCSIWKSKLEDNQIIKASKLNKNINNPSYNNTQPNLAMINGQLNLFFVSNRSEGFGGLDIWVAKKEPFGFGEAVNLGANINSPDDEITPYYDVRNEMLYFSSNWHIGFGGFDLFKSDKASGSYKKAKNLGYGINSFANEYYFNPHKNGAIYTSNRSDGNIEKRSSCCNDLFEVDYKIDETKEVDPIEKQIVVNEVILNKYLPLNLYFHNDEPNPNSRDTTTSINYEDLARGYAQLEPEYLQRYLPTLSNKEKEEASAILENFFELDVRGGTAELKFFTPLLLRELQKGSQVVLTIKGYASSVSKTDYNLNLTLRRIESLINYFRNYGNGAFLNYLNGTSEDGGSLTINKVPFGEFVVQQQINEDDRITAVYSPKAAYERKIELVAISSTESNSQLNTEKQASISFNSKSYDLESIQKGETVSRNFQLKNSGEGELKLYSVSSNCDCAIIDYPQTIGANGEGNILVTIDTKELKGEVSIDLLVVSNTINNLNTLKIQFNIEE